MLQHIERPPNPNGHGGPGILSNSLAGDIGGQYKGQKAHGQIARADHPAIRAVTYRAKRYEITALIRGIMAHFDHDAPGSLLERLREAAKCRHLELKVLPAEQRRDERVTAQMRKRIEGREAARTTAAEKAARDELSEVRANLTKVRRAFVANG
jgi:hypothetical protein